VNEASWFGRTDQYVRWLCTELQYRGVAYVALRISRPNLTAVELVAAVGGTLRSRAVPPAPVDRTPKLGFELEVEFGGDRGARADYAYWCALLQQGQCATDGSLHCGWEFKTGTPLTLAAWRAVPLAQGLAQLVDAGAVESHERAGLHVHIDRASFSPAGLARLFTVVNHRDAVVHALSRRGPNTTYCTFNPTVTDWAAMCTSVGKYSAAYLHPVYPTVELRLFRSTVHPERLYAALEAAEALWAYCDTTHLPATGVDWAEWVAAHPNYQCLAAELRRQRALPPAPVLTPVHPAHTVPQRAPAPTPPPPPPAPAVEREALGRAPNATTYYWNPTLRQVEYRAMDGTWRPTDQRWVTPTDDTYGTAYWLREQLRTRGLLPDVASVDRVYLGVSALSSRQYWWNPVLTEVEYTTTNVPTLFYRSLYNDTPAQMHSGERQFLDQALAAYHAAVPR
jgi:hypothetical protein